MVVEAYTNGVSTRKIKHLAESLGIENINAGKVSTMNKNLDEMAVMIVKAINMDGKPEIIAVEAMENESKATCTEFFNKLKARGHEKMWLCVSDAHAGLQAAIKNINASYSLVGDSCCLCFEYKIHLDFFSRVKNYKDNLPLKNRLSFFYWD